MAEKKVFCLPEAAPGTYLAWVAYWREVEDRMLRYPALEEMASRESAPFLRDPVAEFLSDVFISQVAEQARRAADEGRLRVAPLVRADPDRLTRGLDYVVRRAAWLEKEWVQEALRIRPLEAEAVVLREGIVRAVREQLEARPDP